jgi:hypothetical protein
MIRHPSPPELAAAILVSLGLLVSGCGGSSDSDATPPDPDTSATPEHLAGDDAPLTPATYQFSFLTNSGVDAPDALVTVPSGFDDGGEGPGFFVVSPDGDAFLGLWTVGQVQGDACLRPVDDYVDPGPSVEDLADALVSQKSTRAGAPRPVTLAGYEGLYVELTGPRDISRCDPGPELWADPGGRGIYGDNQVDEVWILDVDGQRLVVDASYGPTATASEIDELTSMVDSMELVVPTTG